MVQQPSFVLLILQQMIKGFSKLIIMFQISMWRLAVYTILVHLYTNQMFENIRHVCIVTMHDSFNAVVIIKTMIN